MQVFAPPTHIGPPPTYAGDFDALEAAEAAWLDTLRTYCMEFGKGAHRGKMVYIPWADGAAQYMVLTSTRLLHVPLGDAWHVPDYMTRGLRAADLARMAS